MTELLGKETARFPLSHIPLHWGISSVQPSSVQLAKDDFCSVHFRFSSVQFCPFHFRPSSDQFSSLRFVSLHFRSLHFASPQFRFRFSSVQFGSARFSSVLCDLQSLQHARWKKKGRKESRKEGGARQSIDGGKAGNGERERESGRGGRRKREKAQVKKREGSGVEIFAREDRWNRPWGRLWKDSDSGGSGWKNSENRD